MGQKDISSSGVLYIFLLPPSSATCSNSQPAPTHPWYCPLLHRTCSWQPPPVPSPGRSLVTSWQCHCQAEISDQESGQDQAQERIPSVPVWRNYPPDLSQVLQGISSLFLSAVCRTCNQSQYEGYHHLIIFCHSSQKTTWEKSWHTINTYWAPLVSKLSLDFGWAWQKYVKFTSQTSHEQSYWSGWPPWKHEVPCTSWGYPWQTVEPCLVKYQTWSAPQQAC